MPHRISANETGIPGAAAAMPAPVVLLPQGGDPAGHRLRTTAALAERIARLRGSLFLGIHEAPIPGARYYAVPTATLIGGGEAALFGIENEFDLFGGLVPYPVQAGKAITHGLVDEKAHAPAGYSPGFASAVRHVVLDGFSAFDVRSAHAAGRRLVEAGPVRLKPAWADGGLQQEAITDLSTLDAALDRLDQERLDRCGLVLEQDLTENVVYSIGRVRIGGRVLSYYGFQTATTDNSGRAAYGGSTLTVVPGELDGLLALPLDEGTREAVRCALAYDGAALAHFPGLIASRRNYDVICGEDAAGMRKTGVLEQSWRIGGASGAEIAAFEAFAEDPTLTGVRAACVEVYGARPEPPADGFVYFTGDDPEVGPLTKYARIEARYRAL
ncbi:MAG: biotin carboxylase [Xanthobacteraceae bacterium]|jgi:hypothetical protein|nr:biotin carboxylase [Xanthobacteraceae bacterium]